jgi:hypothetical protein
MDSFYIFYAKNAWKCKWYWKSQIAFFLGSLTILIQVQRLYSVEWDRKIIMNDKEVKI